MDSSAGKTDGGRRFCSGSVYCAEDGGRKRLAYIYCFSEGHTGASGGQGDPRSKAASNAPTSPSLRPCSPHNLK